MIEQIKRLTPKQYLVELTFILVAILGFYLVIAWLSYNPLDSAWSVSSSQIEVFNKAGILGAWLIDLLFSLFGRVGNIIPFVLVIAPISFIRSKRELNLKYIVTRIGGFCLLLLGLTSLFAYLLPDTYYYLSGGIVGTLFNQWLVPLISNVGVTLLALALSSIGFVLSSGMVLIIQGIKLYRWLTNQNVPDTIKNKENQEVEEIVLEEIILPPLAPKERSVVKSEDLYQKQSTLDLNEDEKELVDINQFTHKPEIYGLQQPTLEQDEFDGSRFGGYDVDNGQALPNITISENFVGHSVMSDSRGIITIADVQEKMGDNIGVNITMPKVSLSSEFNLTAEASAIVSPEGESAVEKPSIFTIETGLETMENHFPSISLPNEKQAEFTSDNDDFAHLAKEFEARESARLEEQEVRAKQFEKSSIVQTEENNTANYKPYSDTLLHPLLQPELAMEKPTTPLPTIDLFKKREPQTQNITEEDILNTSARIEQKLRDFGVKATVKDVLIGPVVTRYELELQPGVKASKVTNIERDLARALTFKAIRVAEVIPGKPYIGIEVPNEKRQIVWMRDVLESEDFQHSKMRLPLALGKDISNKPVVIDLARTPHMLVAGQTGSGKSVGVNSMIVSLLFKFTPDQLKFIMIDPKQVELEMYKDIPHLLTPVVTDMKKAANALNWCVAEMERRYQLLSKLYVRNIDGYNEKIDKAEEMGLPIPNPIWKQGDTMDQMPPALEKMSYIVVIVDEFADLMMVEGKNIEIQIARLTQKARAVGIHVLLATQRPSVDVVTGLIKSNIPTRIAFTVAQRNDSRTILDQNGAEALLGWGDMLYLGNGTTDLIRVHGAFMEDEEAVAVANNWRARGKPHYIDAILESAGGEESDEKKSIQGSLYDLDPMFNEVMEYVIESGNASASIIQRKFRLGFNRAARIVDQLEEQGIVSPLQGNKREVLARRSEF